MTRDRTQFFLDDIFAGQDREHAGSGDGNALVDTENAGMRVGRARDIGEGRFRDSEIVGVMALAGEQPLILAAAYRRAEPAFRYCFHVP